MQVVDALLTIQPQYGAEFIDERLEQEQETPAMAATETRSPVNSVLSL